MNILTISDSAWDDINSIGNTFSNFFSDWNDAKFYNIYFRDALPDNKVCFHYYRISLRMLVKNVFTPWKIGEEFVLDTQSTKRDTVGENERKIISVIHRYNLKFTYTIERYMWERMGWNNKRLANYVSKIQPNVVFAFALDTLPNMLLIKYLKSHSKAKIVLFIADDVYEKYRNCDSKKMRQNAVRYRMMLESADKIYGASEELCQSYSQEFGLEITPLYKGCIFKKNKSKKNTGSLSMVYAGNLQYGRFNTLLKLAETIRKINNIEQEIHLSIYSPTVITEAQKRLIEIPGVSTVCGVRSYNEIMDMPYLFVKNSVALKFT